MSIDQLIIQSIGLVAILLSLVSFQPKHRKNILHLQLAANIFWVAHFLSLGATTGAAMNACGALRAYVFNRIGKRAHRPLWPLLTIMLLMVGASVISWQGSLSLLPLAGMLIGTIGFWQRDEQRIRLILLATVPLWLVYDGISGSYVGVANELFALASLIIALWRHRQSGWWNPAAKKSIKARS